MKTLNELVNHKKTLVLACAEWNHPGLDARHVLLMREEGACIRDNSTTQLIAEKLEINQCEQLIVLGHLPCKIIENTLLSKERKGIDMTLFLHLEYLLNRIVSSGSVKPQELMTALVRENVEEQLKIL